MSSVFGFIFAYMYMYRVPSWCLRRSEAEGRRQKRESEPLELELQMVLSQRAGTRNWTQVLGKSHKGSKMLSHLASPCQYFYNPSAYLLNI